ncbi:MAG TPA: pilus assembly protein PilM [Verrucomicrobiota bacterium]|nr:pilus assembly protein PilM [Verrucomicrobiota bacterium]
MGLPFFVNGARTKRDQMVAIDLGSRTTKAVHVQKRGQGYIVTNYMTMDAPIYAKSLSADLLAEHLKALVQGLATKTKSVTLAVGVNDSVVRLADMPRIPVADMRQAIKFNPKNYLQQDLPNHTFDCYVVPPGATPVAPGQKQKVLVAGIKTKLLEDLQEACKMAGLSADHIVPGLICPVNAFEVAVPESFQNEIVALVDIGFKSTFVCILQQGTIVLNRVVSIGSNQLTEGVAESMNISYAEAENIKLGMPQEVQSQLESQLLPLGRELRASIDFFEHQNDRAVSRVYLSGGATRSELILQYLQTELMVECATWNPAGALPNTLPESQAADFPQAAPQLGVALGAVFAAL